MAIPKKKTNIKVYKETELTERRQELLDRITKSDTFLPDSILHDDLDRGMLDYVKENFKITSNGQEVPVIDKILTIQRWSEFSENWQFSNEDGNMELPFVATIRKPEVLLGTNPSVQRTIPDRHQFYYASVPTWNGNTMGADIYTIPQPIPVDINYEVIFVCTKFRDLNRFNRAVLENFASRQDYTTIKGHYIPIILDGIEDGSPIDSLDGRRFYMQTYKFVMLGYLIDSEEFEVKPAVSRLFTVYEFLKDRPKRKIKLSNKDNIVQTVTFIADGIQTQFSVGISIGTLFDVKQNDNVLILNQDYYHVPYTSNINFDNPPEAGTKITVQFFPGKTNRLLKSTGKILQFIREKFVYDGTQPLNGNGHPIFTVSHQIDTIVTVETNGLAELEGVGFDINSDDNTNKSIIILGSPVLNSEIGISYLY